MAWYNEAWFVHAVDGNVTQLAQQKVSKLTGSVRRRDGVVGKTWPFNRIASIDMQPVVARDADTVYANPPQSKRRAVLRDFSLAVLIDEFDELKTLTNPLSEHAAILAFARERKLDDLAFAISTTGVGGILGLATTVDEAAESTGTQAVTQTIAHGGTGLTMAKLRQAGRMFDVGEVGTDRYAIVSPFAIEDLLSDNTVTSSDFGTIKRLEAGTFGQDEMWMGFKWRKFNRLPQSGNIVSCCFYEKNSVGLAVGKIGSIEIDKAVHKNNNMQALVKLSAGVVRIDDAGVIEVQFDVTA